MRLQDEELSIQAESKVSGVPMFEVDEATGEGKNFTLRNTYEHPIYLIVLVLDEKQKVKSQVFPVLGSGSGSSWSYIPLEFLLNESARRRRKKEEAEETEEKKKNKNGLSRDSNCNIYLSLIY
jgi:hypothetical protein